MEALPQMPQLEAAKKLRRMRSGSKSVPDNSTLTILPAAVGPSSSAALRDVI